MSAVAYRPEIDGLRALAVLPVMAFHAGVSGFSGGFVGVDVFFVISGYLVGGIIWRQLQERRFSFVNFYRRRALRILPLLLCVMLVTLLLGYFVLLPPVYRDLQNSALFATLFSSNVHFWQAADYFQGPKEYQPLLHTWSLGVEEQFYLLLPLALLLLHRLARFWTIPLLLAGCALSLWLCEVALSLPRMTAASGAFYLLPFRFWELGLGVVLALWQQRCDGFSWPRRLRDGLSLLGLGLILLAVVGLDPQARFPGIAALPACGGALLMLAAGGDSLAGRWLSWRPLVGVGLLSYALYLWHWPLVVYLNLLFDLPAPLHALLVFGLSLGLAFCSYHLLERPCRYGLAGVSGVRVLATTAALLLAVALSLQWLAGRVINEGRFDSRVLAVADYLEYEQGAEYRHQFRVGRCFLKDEPFAAFDRAACLGALPGRNRYLLLGDSHAAHFWRGLSESLGPQVTLLEASATACRPLLGHYPGNECGELMRYVLETWLPSAEIDTVILSARWREHEDLAELEATLQHVRQFVGRVIVLGPTVEYHGALPQILANELQQGDGGRVEKYQVQQRRRFEQRMRDYFAAREDPRVSYISVYELVCDSGHCRRWAAEGVPMQFDYGHFTLAGARALAPQLVERMAASDTDAGLRSQHEPEQGAHDQHFAAILNQVPEQLAEGRQVVEQIDKDTEQGQQQHPTQQLQGKASSQRVAGTQVAEADKTK